MYKGFFYDDGTPTPPSTLEHVYFQNNTLFIDDNEPDVIKADPYGEQFSWKNGLLEYVTFIVLDRDDVPSVEHYQIMSELPTNPNTGDTSLRSLALPLIAISLVSASVVWCAKKKKRA